MILCYNNLGGCFMKDYALLITADLFLAINFAIGRIYQKKAGVTFKASFMFSALTSVFTSLIFFLYNGFEFEVSLFSVGTAVLLGLLGSAYTLIGFRIMQRDGMSLYTLFLMTGGMTVPYLFGLFFLGEEFSVLRCLGLIIIIGGVFFSASGKRKPDRRTLILCAAVFILNGCVSVVNKLHSINSELAVTPSNFVVLSGLTGALVNLVLLFTVRDPKPVTHSETLSRSTQILSFLILPISSALVGGISSVLQLTGAATIDASLLYPFITGGSIVFSALTGIIMFHERPSRGTVISIVLSFIGTLFFLEF